MSVQSPKLDFLPDNLYSLDLLVVPMWGLYANMIAQLISQVSSHFIIHYHRNIVFVAETSYRSKHNLVRASVANLDLANGSETSVDDSPADNPYGNRKDLLSEHAFARPHRGEANKLIARRFVNALVVFSAVALTALIIVGCILPSTGMEFVGVLGVAVESGQEWQQAVTELSVFDLTTLLMNQARFVGSAKDYVGLGTLCALLVITVLIVPIVQTATLMYQWFVPMDGRRRQRLSIAVEVLQAWQYAEVYIISIIVATWQLGPLSTFMINYYCQDLQETFDLLAYFGVLSPEDSQCFRVDAAIESAAYLLAIGAALLALLNTFVMNASKQYFRDRDELISRAELKERFFISSEGGANPNSLASKNAEKGSGADGHDVAGQEVWEGREEAESYIKPVPVLFTDKFRWLLRNATSSEELNGVEPPAASGRVTEKPSGSSNGSTSEEEQMVTPPRPMTRIDDDPNRSMMSSSVYLED